MSDTAVRLGFEFFYSMFPVPFFLQLLELLAAALGSFFGIFGLDVKVLAF